MSELLLGLKKHWAVLRKKRVSPDDARVTEAQTATSWLLVLTDVY